MCFLCYYLGRGGFVKGYILDYRNESEYKKLERALRKYEMLAFKKLNFEYYPSLRTGEFLGKLISIDKINDSETYEIKLPCKRLFTQVHGDLKFKYTVYKSENIIMLETIMPTDILIEAHIFELTTYKGVIISKTNAEKDKFMVNLFSALNDD